MEEVGEGGHKVSRTGVRETGNGSESCLGEKAHEFQEQGEQGGHMVPRAGKDTGPRWVGVTEGVHNSKNRGGGGSSLTHNGNS